MKHSFFSVISYVLTGFILILTLVHYNLTYGNTVMITDFIENPPAYAGVERSVMGVYNGNFADGFILRYNQKLVAIFYDHDYLPPRYGEVLVYGQLQQDGSIKALAVHNYDYNFVIYGISFIAGIFVLFSFFKEWKITTSGFVRRL